MKTTISYKDSPAPAADAVADIQEYLGNHYNKIARKMRDVTNPDQFAFYCDLAGITGYPIEAWYEHFHGQGSWDKMTKGE